MEAPNTEREELEARRAWQILGWLREAETKLSDASYKAHHLKEQVESDELYALKELITERILLWGQVLQRRGWL